MFSKTTCVRLAALHAALRAGLLEFQNLHWTAKGQSYYSDHLLFMRLYEALEDPIDALAERIVALCGERWVAHHIHVKTTLLYLEKSHIHSPDKRAKAVCDRICTLIDQCLQTDDLKAHHGMQDHLQGLANLMDEQKYLLKQRYTEVF